MTPGWTPSGDPGRVAKASYETWPTDFSSNQGPIHPSRKGGWWVLIKGRVVGSDKRAGGGFCKDHTDPTRPPWTRQIGDGYDEISPSEHDTWTQSDSRSILFHRDPRPNLFFSSHELYGVNRHHIATVSRYIPTQDWVTFPLSYAEVQLGYGETSLWARRSIRFHDFLIAHETVDRRRLWLLNDDASPSIS